LFIQKILETRFRRNYDAVMNQQLTLIILSTKARKATLWINSRHFQILHQPANLIGARWVAGFAPLELASLTVPAISFRSTERIGD
jgi:hypothetical protein